MSIAKDRIERIAARREKARNYWKDNEAYYVYSLRNKRTGKFYYGHSKLASTLRYHLHMSKLNPATAMKHSNSEMLEDALHSEFDKKDWEFQKLHFCKNETEAKRIENWYLVNNVGSETCYNKQIHHIEPLSPSELS